MEEDCPTCLEKGIKSSVTFLQFTLDSAILACSNLNCSFPFDRQYRDVIWKRNYRDINKERNPKIKLEDVILKDVKPIDDYFNYLELPDIANETVETIVANETVETADTSPVGSSSLSVDFSTLLALSEEDAQPLVVDDEKNPNNPVSESHHCISNSSFNMDNSPCIMGDLSFLEIDSKKPAEMRTMKGSAVEETHSGSESDSGIPVIEIESEDEEERHEKWWRVIGGGNSLCAINENSLSEIGGNPSSGRDCSFEVEKNLLIDSDNNNVRCEKVTTKKPVSVDGVKTYIVICKDVVPTFDVDQLKRNGISVQILHPNSNLKTVDTDEPDISSVNEMIGSDYSSSGHISNKPGGPYSVVEDKVRIWLGDNLGSESEIVITPAHLFHYIVQNFVSKPENGEVRTAAVDGNVEEVSSNLSEEIGIISENLSAVSMDDTRNFCADASFETDSVPSKESAGRVSREAAEQWSKKASERFSKLKSLTTAVSSNSSTKPLPHSNLLTQSKNSVSDGAAFLPPAVSECAEESCAPYVTKRRRCTWRNTDSNATTSDSTKDTSSDNQTLDELNEGVLLKGSFSSRSPIRRSITKVRSLFKTSPIVRQARLIKYKANRFRRQSKIAHWSKSVISPDTTLQSSDVASSVDNKAITLSEPSSPIVKQFDIRKTKIAQWTEICTQSLESIHLGNVSACTCSSSLAEESLSSNAAECVTSCSQSLSASCDKSPSLTKTIPSTRTPSPTKTIPSTRTPSPTKTIPSTRTPSPIRSKRRIPQVIKSVISSSDTTVTVHSKEELVINEESFSPCEAKSSTSPAVKSASPVIDNSTSTSNCILLNKQTSSVHESEQKELDNVYMTDTVPSHAEPQSLTIRSIVKERSSQRSKRIQLRRSFKSSTKPTSVKSLFKELPDSIDMDVNCEKLSTSNNTEELSETIESTSEECVSDLAVRRQNPPRSEVPQLKRPLRSSPKSTNSVKSDKPSDVQETSPPLTERYVTKSVTSPVKKSAATAAKQSPRLKSYRSRKSFTPPSAKSMRIRKSVESLIKSKVTHLRNTRIVHLRKRISKSPISASVQSPKVTRKSLLSSATDDLDKSHLSSSESNFEMKPDRNITRRLAISDSSSVKLRVHDSALKRSPRSVLSATSSQSSRLQRTTGTASRKAVAPARNMALDLGTASASAEQPVKHTRSSSIGTKKSVNHSLHTKPVTLSNTAAKRSSLTKLSASEKLKTLRTTRRSIERSFSSNTSSRAKTTSLAETSSAMKRKEIRKCCRPTRSSVTREETSTTRRSNSVNAVRECKKSAAYSTVSSVSKSCREVTEIKPGSSGANSTASSVSKSCREAAAEIKPGSSGANSTASSVSKSCREAAAEIKPDASPQAASVMTEASPVRKSYRQKHLLQGSLASSSTKTLSSTRLLESNLKQNLKCSNVSVVIVKSPAANAALLKLRKATARASGIPPVTQSKEKCLGIHRMNPVKAAAAPLSCRAYVKLHRISMREGFNLRHISKIMKEKDSFKAEGTCRTVFPSKLQKSDSDLQQKIAPPSEPSILELRKKDSIEKENFANSKKRRKYIVDVTRKPRQRSVDKVSSSEEIVLRTKAEGTCRTVFPSKLQKSDSDLQQKIAPPSEPSILELRKKDSIEKENFANSKKRRKYIVDVTRKPRRRSVDKVSSSEENVLRTPSSVALKSQSEQLTGKSRVVLTRVSETLLSNKNLSKQVSLLCTKGVVSREDVNTRRMVRGVAHQSRSISCVKERRNVQPELEAIRSSYMVRGLVSLERRPRRTCNLQRAKGTPERCSARARSCKK